MKNPSAPSTSFPSPKSDAHASGTVADTVEPTLLPAPPGWPILDHRALPGVVRDIVQVSCARSEADPAAVLVSVLVWFAASFGAQPHVMVGDTRHFARLFIIKVGATSRARKGTSEDPVKLVFRAAEALESGKAGFLPLTVKPGPLSTGEGLINAVRDRCDERGEDGVLINRAVADKRLLVIDGEMAAALKAAQREGNILSAVMRTMWDSGNIAPLTKKHPIEATGAHLCVNGHITGGELGQLLQTTDISNGYANRFLFWEVRRPKLVAMPCGINDQTLSELAQRVRKILDHARTVHRVEWSAEAIQDWCALYPSVSVDEDGAFGAVTARAEAQLVRLALIFALIDKCTVIQARHLMAAAAVWEYSRASARYIFQGLSEDVVQTRILSVLRSGPLSSTGINVAFGGHLPSSRLKQALAVLQSAGQISAEQEKTSGRSVTLWSLVATNNAIAVTPPFPTSEIAAQSFSAKSASSADGDGQSLVDRLQRMSDERASEQLRSIGLR